MAANVKEQQKLAFADTVEHQLAKDRLVHMTGVIIPQTYHEYVTRLRYLDSVEPGKLIKVYLSTPGGSLLDAFGLYDVIHDIAKRTPVEITGTGFVMLAGVLIMQAATKRLSYPNTQFMVHELSSNSEGKLSDLRERQSFEIHLQDAIDEIMSKRTGMTVDELRNKYQRRDLYLTATEAKKLHFIDSVVS